MGVRHNDEIEVRSLLKTVLWDELDRWNYSNPAVPIPPPYTLYTYLTLKESFQAFLILIGIHTLVIVFAKIATSAEFRARHNSSNVLLVLGNTGKIQSKFVCWTNHRPADNLT